jgi:hypothetical protein
VNAIDVVAGVGVNCRLQFDGARKAIEVRVPAGNNWLNRLEYFAGVFGRVGGQLVVRELLKLLKKRVLLRRLNVRNNTKDVNIYERRFRKKLVD